MRSSYCGTAQSLRLLVGACERFLWEYDAPSRYHRSQTDKTVHERWLSGELCTFPK